MHLCPSDLHTYLWPSECDLRVYLRAKGVSEAAPGPYEQAIERLGKRHEEVYRGSVARLLDLSQVSWADRVARTKAEISRHAVALYQPALEAQLPVNGITHRVSGVPDFLLFDGEHVVVQDCKTARRITREEHPEILRTMELYGWLIEQTIGKAPARLEVYDGTGERIVVDYSDGGDLAKNTLEHIVSLRCLNAPPFHPVGRSNCGGCGFQDRCWEAARARHDVSVVMGVDANLARALHDDGVDTYDQLLERFGERRLAAFEGRRGNPALKARKKAASILCHARAWVEGCEIVLQAPAVPVHRSYVMFDLKTLPPQVDETDKVYLWGLGVYQDTVRNFTRPPEGFGPDGDRRGWERFLNEAGSIFATYGDIPFVHWASCERTKVRGYLHRYGDRDGIAARVLANLLDLLPVMEQSVVWPLPSYNLAVVARHAGLQRTQTQHGGDWAMAAYIEAVETDDTTHRDELVPQILTDNREDLDVMWAVMGWLRKRPFTAGDSSCRYMRHRSYGYNRHGKSICAG